MLFYFLLRVGEYTNPRTYRRTDGLKVHTTRKKIEVGNVGFFKVGRLIPCAATLKNLLTADLVVLKISNQKNGRMGQTINQHATFTPECPAKALTHIVFDILSNGGTDTTLLCAFKDNTGWTPV